MSNKVPLVVADFETQIAGAISAGDTSFTLASATDDDGNTITAGKYCFTVNNGASNKQYLIGQVNGTAVTSVSYVDRQGNETSGAQYAARSGSPVIISNFASLQRVADILRGQETLDADNPIYYDGDPTLSNNAELATVKYVLDNVNGGAVDFDNQIISSSDATAGETIAAGDVVFFQTSDQEWYQADADTAAEVNGVQLGIALGAGSDGASITGGIQISGVYTTTGLTAGDTYYVGNTPGQFTNSAGTTARTIGVALSTTKLLLVPTTVNTLTDDEKDALAGTSGSPSTSNKYVTADDVANDGTSAKIIRASGTDLPLAITQATKGLDISGATTDLAQSGTTEYDVYSYTVAANTLGTGNSIRVKIYLSDLTQASSAGTTTFRLKYGSTTIASFVFAEHTQGALNLLGTIEAVVTANASASAQTGFLSLEAGANNLDLDSAWGAAGSILRGYAAGTATEDSTGALDLKITAQSSQTNGMTDIVPASIVTELIS